MSFTIKEIPVGSLIVNSENDRHGEVDDERAAIATLLGQLPGKMRNLAKDIAEKGQLFMLPLVTPNGDGTFSVCDGNRRITCVKLLANPMKSPDADWRRFFQETKSKFASTDVPDPISCQVSDDQDWIDDYLYRIHTGSQNGVGQINWGNPQKANFQERTGKTKKLDISRTIEDVLQQKGLISENTKFRHANLDRILSSEEFRQHVGITLKGNKLFYTKDPQKTLSGLSHIVKDLSSGELNLNHLLKNEKKRDYLSRLDEKGILPVASDRLDNVLDFQTEQKGAVAPSKGTTRKTSDTASTRRFLIRSDDLPDFPADPSRKRAKDIWVELQYRLEFGRHDNAIAVLFRVLTEFSIEHYILENALTNVSNGDSLAKKYGKVLAHLEQAGAIDKKYAQTLRKFVNTEPIISANTFNKYVHDRNFYPSDHHLRSMWDTLYPFVLKCLQ
ncbi:MAG: hypothetical protein CMI63_19390 [Parvularcula sp.]|nr:hypothetical protein [Parvularcula sp.]